MQIGYIEIKKPDDDSNGCIEDYLAISPIMQKQIKNEFSIIRRVFHNRYYQERKKELYEHVIEEITEMFNNYGCVELVRNGKGDWLDVCLDVDSNKERWNIIKDMDSGFKKITGLIPSLNVCFFDKC